MIEGMLCKLVVWQVKGVRWEKRSCIFECYLEKAEPSNLAEFEVKYRTLAGDEGSGM